MKGLVALIIFYCITVIGLFAFGEWLGSSILGFNELISVLIGGAFSTSWAMLLARLA